MQGVTDDLTDMPGLVAMPQDVHPCVWRLTRMGVACRRPYAEDALRKAGEAEFASPAKYKWKPFGADHVTEWPPRTSEVLAY